MEVWRLESGHKKTSGDAAGTGARLAWLCCPQIFRHGILHILTVNQCQDCMAAFSRGALGMHRSLLTTKCLGFSYKVKRYHCCFGHINRGLRPHARRSCQHLSEEPPGTRTTECGVLLENRAR